VALVHQHQVALAEAALEAHLQHQRSVDRQVGSVAAWEATKWEAQAQQT